VKRRLRCPAPPGGDAGLTLIEVMVAMGLMSVVMVMATGALVEIYHSVNASDHTTVAQNQVTAAFVRLDQEVRYARAISTPALVDGDNYVEYLLSVNNADTCVELRLQTSTNQLQRRQWTKNADPPAPTAWTTLADVVTSGVPFTTILPDKVGPTGFRFQRLRLTVSAVLGGGTGGGTKTSGGTTRQTDVTFTALNATAGKRNDGTDPNAATCIEARGIQS
jgi:prepilin-type N-terminal cleavage/methylation domain-containing protein